MKPTVYQRGLDRATRRAMRGEPPVLPREEQRIISNIRVREFTRAVQGDVEMFDRLMHWDPLFQMIVKTGQRLHKAAYR